jgi:hypothetical protein
VHYKNSGTVKLRLGEIVENGNISVKENSSPLQYTIDGEPLPIELGKEFTIRTPSNSTVLNIKDVDGNIKGQIEFRQITEPLLQPTLNIVTINTDELGIGYSFPTVFNDLNAVYSTMNVNWQQGNHIRLNTLSLAELERIGTDEIVRKKVFAALEKLADYKENQYYLIISPEADDWGGITHSLHENWFVVQKTYDNRHSQHELGHCNGLDEFAVNIGLVNAPVRNNSKDNVWQYRSTNIMGYSNWQYPPVLPLKDFFSWQIPLIRTNINNHINKK